MKDFRAQIRLAFLIGQAGLATWAIPAQTTMRVSVASGGAQGTGGSYLPSISADGRFVAFSSRADDLVPGDTNGNSDILLRDRQSGATELVTVGASGAQSDGHSALSSVSADGRYVAFESEATNLVLGDTNGFKDVFVRDRQSGTTVIVSQSSGGAQGNDRSHRPSISADGRFVAFDGTASNLVPGDTNGVYDVFVRDLQSGTTERVSVSSAAAPGDGESYTSCISADGRWVGFQSGATNLVAGDSNGRRDIFVHDRQTDTTERVSIGAGGAQGNQHSDDVSVSSDGRYLAFGSIASNLVAGDTNGFRDVFVRDRQDGTTERVSIPSGGGQANDDSASVFLPSVAISADGRYVAFQSYAQNLVPGDTNLFDDIFVHDRLLGTTERVSVDSAGGEADGYSTCVSISADGRHVVFSSTAGNLVPVDTNGWDDVFVRDRNATGFTSICHPGEEGVIACPCSNPPSAVGRGCDNSAATGGALLSASGVAYLSADSLVFTTSGEKAGALSLLNQRRIVHPPGTIAGMGVQCSAGHFVLLYAKSASGGSITAPDFAAGEPSVSARSAALGHTIQPGQSRWYSVVYRDPVVLGGCPAASTFNTTQTGRIDWSP